MNNIEVCDCRIVNPSVVEETKAKINGVKIFSKMAAFYKIMGDETRMKIIYALMQNELCVNDIANVVDMTKSSVSHQLRKLKDFGVLKNRRDGKVVYYSLDDEHVVEIFSTTLSHIEHKVDK